MALQKMRKQLGLSKLLLEETNPNPQWILPEIPPADIYKHKSMFALRASTYYFDSREVLAIPRDGHLHFFPLSPALVEHVPKALEKGYHLLHLGLCQFGVNPLF